MLFSVSTGKDKLQGGDIERGDFGQTTGCAVGDPAKPPGKEKCADDGHVWRDR